MTSEQLKAIEAHGRKLLAIFPGAREQNPVKLCKKLRALEAQAHGAAMALCNVPNYQDQADEVFAIVETKVLKLLGNTGDTLKNRADYVPIIINRDPRGYALKIESEWIDKQRSNHETAYKASIKRDMGGYGIIAPEIDKNGNY